jgi:hypothetical protein
MTSSVRQDVLQKAVYSALPNTRCQRYDSFGLVTFQRSIALLALAFNDGWGFFLMDEDFCMHTILKTWIIVGLCFFFTASPVVAEEVLNCVDTAGIGFEWGKNGDAKLSKFKSERHTVKVVSDIKRLIARMQGDTAGTTNEYECEQYKTDQEVVMCQDSVFPLEVWSFYRDAYTRAFLFGGPPASGRDPNISIAYGTCTKF